MGRPCDMIPVGYRVGRTEARRPPSTPPAAPDLPEVEPLSIPRAADRFAGDCTEAEGGCRYAWPDRAAAPAPDTAAARTAWVRWIVGHQVLLMVWRLLGSALERHRGECTTPSVEPLITVSSVLLLYTGSCSSTTYLAVLRPAMARQHPAFSGEWATDYQRLPALVREVADPSAVAAWRLYQNIHATVAEKLVPGKPSLLREAGRQAGRGANAAEAQLFDSFFLVRRASVCRLGFRMQLVRRLARVLDDLRRRGLYYDSPPASRYLRTVDRDPAAHLESAAVSILAGHAPLVDDAVSGWR